MDARSIDFAPDIAADMRLTALYSLATAANGLEGAATTLVGDIEGVQPVEDRNAARREVSDHVAEIVRLADVLDQLAGLDDEPRTSLTAPPATIAALIDSALGSIEDMVERGSTVPEVRSALARAEAYEALREGLAR